MSLAYGIRAITTISNSPGTGGTSIVVATGEGVRFVSGAQSRLYRAYNPSTGATEIMLGTNRATDTFTVTRNWDGGGAQNIVPGAWIFEDLNDLGPDTDLTYDSAFFAAVGGGTWTLPLGAANVERLSWQRTGYKLDYEAHVINTTIVGTVSELNVLMPFAAAAGVAPVSGAAQRGLAYVFEAGTFVQCIWYTNAGDDRVRVQKTNAANFTGTANLNLRLQALVELT